MQTLALMLVAVGLSLAHRDPARASSPAARDRFDRAITPVLDAMQIVPAFAYLMPVVILFSVGPGRGGRSATMIYAIPPAVRITALGIRGVTAEHGRGGARRWARRRARRSCKVQLPLARRHAPARRQPDDPLRALDGRDCRPDRRQGPRRRRDEWALLEPGARGPRRNRDRDHGHRAGPRPPRQSPTARTPPAASSPTRAASCARKITLGTLGPDRGLIVLVAARAGRGRHLSGPVRDLHSRSTTRTSRAPCLGWINDALEYIQDPTSFIFGHHRPGRQLHPRAHAPAGPKKPADGHALVRRGWAASPLIAYVG